MSKINNFVENGYKLISEFETTDTLILWPCRKDVWVNPEKIQELHISYIKQIANYQHVFLGVPKSELYKFEGVKFDNVDIIELPQNDAWIRDTGPLFVKKENSFYAVKNGFNAWGGLYFPFDDDLKIVPTLSEYLNYDYLENKLIMEGGNISSDGNGTAILVEDCIVNKNRNDYSKVEIEKELKKVFGLSKIIWITEGFVEDETGGHVDNIAQFTNKGEIIIAWTEDENHPMYERCRQIEKEIKLQAPERVIHKMILPKPTYRTGDESIKVYKNSKKRLSGDLLTNSYVNFYVAGKAIFVPQFLCEEDELAASKFKEIFPDYDIVFVPARDYILGGGCLHCLTLGILVKEDQ